MAHGIEPLVARPGGDPDVDGVIRYLRIPARGDAASPTDLRWSRKALRAAIRDTGPRLLHLVGDPWTPTAETGAAAARSLGIPYVLVGTSSVGGPRGFTARWQARRVVEGAAALAGTVRPALDLLTREVRPRPAAVIPPGGLAIPPTLWTAPLDGPLRLGLIGRLVPERGVDLLFDALAETYGDWRLAILGTGPSQPALEAQAQHLGLSSRIDWLGALPRDQWAPFLSGIDVLVAPSRSTPQWVEPTGTVVLEAMAAGVAPIVARSGALPDVVGDSGLIIEENDRAALTRAIAGLVKDPVRSRQIGAAARQRVLEHYGDAPVAERMVTLWREVAAN